ncbi:enzymatic polyprotein endonuclease reverse [Lasius niger]|uniref:RNA-directed DNA polymerase n=1 Tax=Lasius niger TaxID=67767 RepID=A0A0J7K7I0_LASNI|nr:enzymatic polyprotein endonuclease reverse [Lasius niger]
MSTEHTKFKIITDHKPLIWLFNVTDPGSRLICWRLKLEEYDYEIHKAGRANANADALGRHVIQDANEIKKKEEVFKIEDNEIADDTQKIYTEEEKQQILYEYHDAPTGGHQRIERTIRRIRLNHHWPGIIKDVERYISKCESCQKK